MRELELEQLKQDIVNAFDKALGKDHWSNGLFFQNIAKTLNDLREYTMTELSLLSETQQNSSASHVRVQSFADKDFVPVFVSLYQTEGSKLERWLNVIKTLTHYTITRPVYRTEQEIQSMIRHRIDPKKEGYVVVYVKKNDILPPYAGKMTHDKLGNELLTLKDGSVAIENIIEFIHDGKRYYLEDGQLVAIGE